MQNLITSSKVFPLLTLFMLIGGTICVYAQTETPKPPVTSSNYPVGLVTTIPHSDGHSIVQIYANVPKEAIDSKSTFFSERFVSIEPAKGGDFYDPQTKEFGCNVEFRPELDRLAEFPEVQREITRLVAGASGNTEGSSIASVMPVYPINPMPVVGYVISLELPGGVSHELKRESYTERASFDGRIPVVAKNMEWADIQNGSLRVAVQYEHKGMESRSRRINQGVALVSKSFQEVMGIPTGPQQNEVFLVTRDVATDLTNSFTSKIGWVETDVLPGESDIEFGKSMELLAKART